jgi:hypothetical protein
VPARSALNALTAAGGGELLDTLLTARPALRKQAEELAIRRHAAMYIADVADDVESDLRSPGIDGLNGRSGYRPDMGYVHPVEPAGEVLGEVLQPYLDDLQRHLKLGMATAAVDLAVAILHGLHRCRDYASESLLEYSPDYADERAAEVVRRCHGATVDLPLDDLAEILTGWESLLRRCGPRLGRPDQ